jgi:hypothetical protein
VSTDFEGPVPQRPMNILELFGSTGRLSLLTIGRGLIPALVLIVPAYMLLGSTLRAFLLELSRIFGAQTGSESTMTPEAGMQLIGDIVGASAMLMFGTAVVVVASTVAQLAVIIDGWDRATGVRRSLGDWLRRLTGRPLASAFAQLFVLMALLSMLLLGTMGIAAVLAGAGPYGASLVSFAFFGAIVFLAIGTVFRMHEIVADDRGPWRSLLSSIALSRGHWIRIVAVLLPLVVIALIATELIGPTAPIVIAGDFAARAMGYRQMAEGLTPERVIQLGALSAIIQFLGINALTALYVELRARRGDFDYDETEQIEGAME